MTARPARGRSSRAQATVELALGLPIVLLILLLVAQLVLVGRDQIMLTHAAREAARAGAVDAEPGAVRAGAEAAGGLDPNDLHVVARRRGGRVEVELTYLSRTDLPLVGPLVPDRRLRADATMRIEG